MKYNNKFMPLYAAISEDLKNQIQRKVLAIGERIPSEPELVKIYHVSRPTVRQAIEILVRDGLVTRIQGKGTFVREQPSCCVVCGQPFSTYITH